MRMRGHLGLTALLLLAACASGPRGRTPVRAPSDDVVKIGAPYAVRGVRYVPADDPYYDAIGLASWYGGESGNRTANGEAHGGRGYSAAHPTLPLPSYVEVTALGSGRTIVVRVNDRGPFAAGRVIDLSASAAKALAIDGTAPVRVRRVFPSDIERAALRGGEPGGPRLTASPQLLGVLRAQYRAGEIVKLAAGPMPDARRMAVSPPASAAAPINVPRAGGVPDMPVGSVALPASSPALAEARPAPSSVARPARARPTHGFAVQLGAFGDAARAASLAREVGARVVPAGALSRVRVGPYASDGAAREALAKLRARGYAGAAIVRE